MKKKTITVSHGWLDSTNIRNDLYRVERVTESLDYNPHQKLTKKEVSDLIGKASWKVTIVPMPGGAK